MYLRSTIHSRIFLLFLQITQHQIKEFGADLGKFQDRFHSEGPGAVGNDLDKGMF